MSIPLNDHPLRFRIVQYGPKTPQKVALLLKEFPISFLQKMGEVHNTVMDFEVGTEKIDPKLQYAVQSQGIIIMHRRLLHTLYV